MGSGDSVRVWDCDPRLLCTKHLRAQHAEIHFGIRVIENDWRTKWKDVERFRADPYGLEWLAFCHEMTVHELQGRGRFNNHKTPVDDLLDGDGIKNALTFWLNTKPSDYLIWMHAGGYPTTQLNQGTPWERDNVTFEWYQAHHNDWTRALAEAEGKR